MNLEKVVIDNFRNINHAEYDLKKINIFAGPNRMGKSNTIIAIYWAITDYLLDGSSDIASLKQIGNERAEVSVELTFSNIKIKKLFYENWVKNRGTKEETMQGHITEFYINDVKTKNSDAKKAILEAFNLNNGFNTSKFDLLQAMVNPYYLASICNGNNWKEARKFIVQLIGDVSNEDVFNENPALRGIQDRLEKDKYDTSVTANYYSAQVKGAKKNIDELEGKIKGLQDIKDIDDTDYKIAKSSIDKANEQIYSIKNNDDSGNKQLISKANEELIALQDKLQANKEADSKMLEGLNKSANDNLDKKNKEYDNLYSKSEDIRNKISANTYELERIQQEIKRLQIQIVTATEEKENLYKRYDDVSERIIEKPTISEVDTQRCPNCNYVLNQDELDKKNKQSEEYYKLQEKNKNEELAKIIAIGKAVAEKLEMYKLDLETKEKLEEPLKTAIQENKNEFSLIATRRADLNEQIENIRKTIRYSFISDKTSELLIEIEKKKEEIKLLNSSDTSSLDKQVAIAEIELSKEEYQKVLNDRNAYLTAQEHIKKFEKEKISAGNEMIEFEQLLLLVNEFTLTKLTMFDKHVSKVFGNRVKFTLIKNNIKEGSWNEVCYPSVIDKDTPFIQGSGSEQILTGIYLIDCIRKEIEVGNLPFIFDEADKLDSNSLASIETESQLITTKVDDINFKEVTLIEGNNK
ncbi:MAG: hypothetical protein GX675_01235 [Erysipelotrichaceae bacterium]|nr:hypothetical protein [Erysipelotrichaceae bacterium]